MYTQLLLRGKHSFLLTTFFFTFVMSVESFALCYWTHCTCERWDRDPSSNPFLPLSRFCSQEQTHWDTDQELQLVTFNNQVLILAGAAQLCRIWKHLWNLAPRGRKGKTTVKFARFRILVHAIWLLPPIFLCEWMSYVRFYPQKKLFFHNMKTLPAARAQTWPSRRV